MYSFASRFVGPLALTVLLVLAFALHPASAQTSEAFDAPYARLDLAETQTGVLANRRAVFFDPGRFAGTSSADTLRPMQWEALYGQFRTSAADLSQFPTPAALAATARSERDAGRLPIALLWQPYDYVDQSSLDDGRLMLDDSGPVEQLYRPTTTARKGRKIYTDPSPYQQSQTFAAGVLYGSEIANALSGPVTVGATTTFVVPSSLFVVPPGTLKPASVQVNAGTGTQTVSLGQPFTATWATPGAKTIRVDATVGGATRQAFFQLYVRPANGAAKNFVGDDPVKLCQQRAVEAPWSPGCVHCGVTPASQYAWSAPRDYPNVLDMYDQEDRVANYDYAVSLVPGRTQITNPVILVSGYDPFEGTGLDEIYQTFVQYDDGEGTAGPLVRLDVALKNQGYDIVVMDYQDSQDFIQRNGLALVDLIRRIHAEMDENINAADEIAAVVGFSTGGLVGRYAFTYMEDELQVDHRVHLFVSYDSPQQGAYVPVGLEMMFADIYELADGVIDITDFFGLSEGLNDFIEKRLYGAATQQLSTFWVGTDSDAASPDAIQTAIREDLYADFIRYGDYPDDLRRVAVSNGNGAGLIQHREVPWSRAASLRMEPGVGQTDQGRALFVKTGASSAWGLFGTHIGFTVRNAPMRGQSAQVYRRHNEACFVFCDSDTSEESTLSLRNPYDIVPGGFRASYQPLQGEGWDSRETLIGSFLSTWIGLSVYYDVDVYAQRHAFVPTLSALDWNSSPITRTRLVYSTFLSQNLLAPVDRGARAERTPFDAVLTADDTTYPSGVGNESQPHLFITDGIESFILYQLAQPVPDRSPPADVLAIEGPDHLAIGQTGTWTAANAFGSTPLLWEYNLMLSVCGGGDDPDPTGAKTGARGGDGGDGPPIGDPMPNEVPCGQWHYGGNGLSYSRSVSADATLALRFTDGLETVYKTVGAGGSGGGAKSAGVGEEAGDGPDATARMASLGSDGPTAFSFDGAAPNPFDGTTTLRYALPEEATVRLAVYDLLGREVARLADGHQEAGYHRARFDGTRLPSGVYVARLEASGTTGAFAETVRITLAR